MPKQKPRRSKQDYGTPLDLRKAIENRFGKIEVDLAATRENTIAPLFYTPEVDSLKQDWVADCGDKLCWLNPPFEDIEKWARKCAWYGKHLLTGRILFLTPASIGSNWFRDYVYDEFPIIALNGRPTFVGCKDPYPKDCMLTIFGPEAVTFEVWEWRKDI